MFLWLTILGAMLFGGVVAAAEHRPLLFGFCAIVILLLTFWIGPADFDKDGS